MNFPEHDFDMALHTYADHLVADYKATGSEGNYAVEFKRGSKFLKVISTSWGSRSVHSFICVKPHDQWKFGDILKAASWAAPAKNFIRGNVLDTESYIGHSWAGL